MSEFPKSLFDKHNIVMKLGGKCSKCGEEDLRVLCFHHKLGGVGSDKWRRMSQKERRENIKSAIESEPHSIQLLCMNCHTKEHSSQEQYQKFSDSIRNTNLRRMMVGKKLTLADLPDGTMVID